MKMEQIDAAMEQAVAAPSNPIVSKCQAADVAYIVVNALAEAAGGLKAIALRWVAGKISEYRRAQGCA